MNMIQAASGNRLLCRVLKARVCCKATTAVTAICIQNPLNPEHDTRLNIMHNTCVTSKKDRDGGSLAEGR